MAELMFSEANGVCSVVFPGLSMYELTPTESGKLYGLFVKVLKIIEYCLDKTGDVRIPFKATMQHHQVCVVLTAELTDCLSVKEVKQVYAGLVKLVRYTDSVRSHCKNRKRKNVY